MKQIPNIEEVTFKDDGYRVTAYKNNKELGVVTEYKYAEYGHLFSQYMRQQQSRAFKNWLKELKDEFYEVDVEKVPSIQDEAYANQFDSKAEAFWYGEKQGLKALQTIIDRYHSELDQDNK